MIDSLMAISTIIIISIIICYFILYITKPKWIMNKKKLDIKKIILWSLFMGISIGIIYFILAKYDKILNNYNDDDNKIDDNINNNKILDYNKI